MKEDIFIITKTGERRFPGLKGVYEKASASSRCCGFQRKLFLLKIARKVPANNVHCHVEFKR